MSSTNEDSTLSKRSSNCGQFMVTRHNQRPYFKCQDTSKGDDICV